jgi:outer membrane protein OmpA-like peptidoglycan-associated protein
VLDRADKCTREPETKNGYKDEDGCPDKDLRALDTDGDGVNDDADKCPIEPEDKDGYADEDGCPDPDNDNDGIPDQTDKCPAEPETINNVEDDDGCPDKGVVRLLDDELETLTPIFFDTDRARVRHAFRRPLNDIAAILIAHPEVGRCAVEGHTDAAGPDEWNRQLSERRAQAVIKYLVGRGVDPARLIPAAQGDALPRASNDTPEGRAATGYASAAPLRPLYRSSITFRYFSTTVLRFTFMLGVSSPDASVKSVGSTAKLLMLS